MFDIGAMELLVVAVVALVVVGPKELPALLKNIAGIVRRVRELASEFRAGIETLADEVEREADPFADLRKEEGLRPGMSPEQITDHILSNRVKEAENKAKKVQADATDDAPKARDTADKGAEK